MNISAIIAIIIAAIAVLSIISLASRSTPKGIDRLHFKNEWNDILHMFKDDKTKEMSIIKADKLLDEALKCLGFSGASMSQRLIGAKHKLKHRDDVWNAHKLRNKIVHESSYRPSTGDIKFALRGYHKTFKDLGVL